MQCQKKKNNKKLPLQSKGKFNNNADIDILIVLLKLSYNLL